MLKLEKTKDGVVKDFSVPNAHHLYVQVIQASNGKVLRKEAMALGSIEELDELPTRIDPDDGFIIGKKWALTPEVIQALKENGDCIHKIPGGIFQFEYLLKPMKYKDELKHRG